MTNSPYPNHIPNHDSKIPGGHDGVEIKKTICAICNPLSHCGIDAYVREGVVIKVEGTKENLHSGGTLCSKGSASRQYIYHKDRILTPLIRTGERGSGEFQPVSWDEALDHIAERLNIIKAKHGPESVTFFAGYPKWMRPFLQRLAHSFGSPNFATESSTCFTAMMLAFKLNYGTLAGPDIKNAKCLLVWSANPFYSNTSTVRRLIEAREKGLKIIEVGPLITPMTSHADIHLRMRPGTSGALALSMAHVIIEEGLYDRHFVEKWTTGFDEYHAYVKGFPPGRGEEITGVPAGLIIKAARLYATTKPAALMPSASPTVHHTNGVQNTRALAALVGLTGNFDREGGNYAQPHSYLEVAGPVKTREAEFIQPVPFSDMPPRVGQDLYPVWCDAIDQAQSIHIPHQIKSRKPYPIRAILAFGINHRMWPGSDFMLENLKKLDFLVDVDLFMTDTAKFADIVLPACTSFERSELKIYPTGGYTIWTEPVIAPLGQSRPDVDIIVDLARRITPNDSLLTKGHEACVDWMLKPSGMNIEKIRKHPGGFVPEGVTPIPFRKYETEGFSTPTGKMEFTSMDLKEAGVDPLPTYREPELGPLSPSKVTRKYPLIMTTGARLPMLHHSRTYRLEWTRRLRPYPMVDMNPLDAEKRGISAEDWVELITHRGAIRVQANLTEVVPPGVVSMFHSHPEADVNLLIDPDYLDPISGFPGFKSLLCEVKKSS